MSLNTNYFKIKMWVGAEFASIFGETPTLFAYVPNLFTLSIHKTKLSLEYFRNA